jgi:hypothetical protein
MWEDCRSYFCSNNSFGVGLHMVMRTLVKLNLCHVYSSWIHF